jgi:hypothetical protein
VKPKVTTSASAASCAKAADRQAGGEGEGVDQPVLQLARRVGRAGIGDGDVEAELLENARPVGAGRAAGRADADALAVEIAHRGDAGRPQRDALERRLVHREERAHVGVLEAGGELAPPVQASYMGPMVTRPISCSPI